MKKRINDYYALSDIQDLIETLIKETNQHNAFQFKDMRPILATLDQVKYRIEQYTKSFVINQNSIISKFQFIFPQAIIKLESSFDCSLTYIVKIYGVERSEENNNKAYDLAEEIEKEYSNNTKDENGFRNSSYSLIPTFLDAKGTEIYYPEVYKELIEKKSP